MISRHRGKVSNNKFSDEFKQEIATLIKENYHDFAPTFAHEKLVENHNKKLSIQSTRQIMIEYEIWQPKIKKELKGVKSLFLLPTFLYSKSMLRKSRFLVVGVASYVIKGICIMQLCLIQS